MKSPEFSISMSDQREGSWASSAIAVATIAAAWEIRAARWNPRHNGV